MILKALALLLAISVIIGFGFVLKQSVDDLSDSIQKIREERLKVGPR